MYTSTLEGCVLGFQLEKNNDWDRVEIVRIVSASQAISSSRAAVRRHCTPRAAVTYYVIAASTIFWRQSKRPSVSPRLPPRPPPPHAHTVNRSRLSNSFFFVSPSPRPKTLVFLFFCFLFVFLHVPNTRRLPARSSRRKVARVRETTENAAVRC